MTPEQTKSAYQRVCEQECEWCAKGYEKSQANNTHLIDDVPSGPDRWKLCTAPSKDAFMERQAAKIAAMQVALAKGRQALYDIGFASALDVACTLENWRLTCDLATGAMLEIDATLSDDIERGKELLGAEKRAAYWQKRLGERVQQAHEAGVSFWTGKDGEGCTNDRAEKAERERDQCADSYIRQQERLTAERDGALQASRYNADVATQAVEEMKRQAVEIEELRKDKVRLDWLQSDRYSLETWQSVHGSRSCVWDDHQGRDTKNPAFESDSVRSAIDAAMKEKP